MSDQTELAVVRQEPAAVAQAEPSLGQMMQAIIQSGVTKENAEVLKTFAELQERAEDRSAKREFFKAFAQMQAKIPTIKATKEVPNKDGSLRYTYAPFEEIDEQARPICLEFGFSYSFAEAQADPGKIKKVCILCHIGGHSRENSYTVAIGNGPPDTSASQKDGSAHTFAKRGALCDALCIRVKGQDNDARLEGGTITKDQAADLRTRVQATGSDEADFLKYATAKTFEQIPSGKYAMLDRALRKKESTK